MKTQIGLGLAVIFGTVFINTESSLGALGDDLVEYWELDGDYDAGIDETHEGTLQAKGTGATESGFVTGKFGQAIDLESSDNDNQASIVIGGDENDFDFAEVSMSVSLWYTTESLYRDWQTLIGKGEGGSWRLARNRTTASQIKLSLWLVAEAKLDQNDGSWHHAVATVDPVEGSRIYVDGELVGTDETPRALGDNGLSMQIGGNPQAADRGWDGMIDDVAIWSRAITEEEVTSIWNEGEGASIASLINAVDVPMAVTAISYSALDDRLTLTWDSKPGKFYSVFFSRDMTDWGSNLEDAIEATGDSVMRDFQLIPAGLEGAGRVYFQVYEELSE